MTLPPPKFSNLQWYLAHAHNSVHLTTYLKRKISEDEFNELVDLMLARAPQMAWREDLEQNRHELVTDWNRDNHIQFIRQKSLPESYSQIATLSALELQNNNGPAFHAVCYTADQENKYGERILLSITVSHAILEGGDLSVLTRAPRNTKFSDQLPGKPAPLMQRVAATTLAPILAIFHLVSANLQRQNEDKFGFASLSIGTKQLRAKAREMELSQRGLLFSLVLFYLRGEPKKKNRMIAYSTLNDDNIAQECDDYLRFKMQVVFVKDKPDFAQFAKSIDGELTKQNLQGNFNQHLNNKILGFHRKIFPFAKWLYSQKFFSYVPYDMVLSLLPSVRATQSFEFLNDAPLFGNSLTGKGENCIIVPGKEHLTFNIWAKQDTIGALKKMEHALEAMGLPCEIRQ